MNILQVCAYAAEYEGNFMKSLYSLENKLNSLGHNVYYAFPEKAKEMLWCQRLEKRTKVFYLPLKMARMKPKTYLYLRKIIKENEIKLVHSHFELYDLPLAMVCKNVKMVWHIHDAIENLYNRTSFLRKMLYKIQYGFLSKKANIISVSEKHLEFTKKFGLRSKNTTVILNGTDLQRIKKVNCDKKKEFDFLIFAWEFDRKGGKYAIEAAEKLEEEGYKFKIAFVGNDNLWRNPQILNVEKKPWLIKQEFVVDVNELYQKSRCFLHISLAEGCSYALEEAIYSGIKVICSNISENSFAFDFPTVSVIKSGDSNALKEAMKTFLDGNSLSDEKDVELSRKYIQDDYSLDAWSNKVINFYNNLENN